MVIDNYSRWPTNCRILDAEAHEPASIRTVRKKDIPFLATFKERTHMIASSAIPLTVDYRRLNEPRGYFDVDEDESGDRRAGKRVKIFVQRYLCQSGRFKLIRCTPRFKTKQT